jgi:hypothetical protein
VSETVQSDSVVPVAVLTSGDVWSPRWMLSVSAPVVDSLPADAGADPFPAATAARPAD